MQTQTNPLSNLEQLKRELRETRENSLKAVNRRDFMKVAVLTTKAARLNQAIFDLETKLMCADV